MSSQGKQEEAPLAYGTAVWLEIPATDVLRAKAFYGKVFDWVFPAPAANGRPIEEMALFRLPDPRLQKIGFGGGGIVRVDARHHIKPSSTSTDSVDYAHTAIPHTYMLVKDIEHSLSLIEQSGGKPAGKKEPEGDGGFTAHFLDTEGNLQGLYELVHKQGS